MTLGSISSFSLAASPGVRMAAPSRPYDLAQPQRRFKSIKRSLVWATSSPPTPKISGSFFGAAAFSSPYHFRECLASSTIVLEEFVRNMPPGACEELPSISNNSPLSITTISFQPNLAK